MAIKASIVTVPIGTTQTKIVVADPSRQHLEIFATSGGPATALGPSGLTYAQGWKRNLVLSYPSSTVEIWALPDPTDQVPNDVSVLEVTIEV